MAGHSEQLWPDLVHIAVAARRRSFKVTSRTTIGRCSSLSAAVASTMNVEKGAPPRLASWSESGTGASSSPTYPSVFLRTSCIRLRPDPPPGSDLRPDRPRDLLTSAGEKGSIPLHLATRQDLSASATSAEEICHIRMCVWLEALYATYMETPPDRRVRNLMGTTSAFRFRTGAPFPIYCPSSTT